MASHQIGVSVDNKRIKEILIKENLKDPRQRETFIDCFLELDPGVFLLEKCEIKGSTLTPEVQERIEDILNNRPGA